MGQRIGLGYDVHPFAGGRPLVLGGVRIESAKGLAGHSDADAVCHAVADALLGALALGDLGQHFPDTDPLWHGAHSVAILREVVRLVGEQGAHIVNADVTVITQEPRVAPYVETMRDHLSEALKVARTRVSVKAKHPEGLGALGAGKGLAAVAAVLVDVAEEDS